MGLWIAGYMVVPITAFAVFGKRLAQLSHRTGAITVPDLFRARFASPRLGLIASLLILCFMSLLMVAQFKAGAIVMKSVWPNSVAGLARIVRRTPPRAGRPEQPPGQADRSRRRQWTAYLVGLAVFSITVVGYTLIGGFLASVWTDMFQSVLMVFGVVLLFVLVVPGAPATPASATRRSTPCRSPAGFASGPGYSATGRSFLPPTLALSYFVRLGFRRLGNAGRHDPRDGRQRTRTPCAARSSCCRFTIC